MDQTIVIQEGELEHMEHAVAKLVAEMRKTKAERYIIVIEGRQRPRPVGRDEL